MRRGARTLLVVTVSVAAVFMIGACRGGGDGPSPAAGSDARSTGAPKVNDRTVTMRYEVKTDGDVAFAYEAETPVRVLTVLGGGETFDALNLLSVGTPQPFQRADGSLARVAFDLTKFRGDGRYAIKAGSPRDLLATADAAKVDPNTAAPDQSNVLVHVWPGADRAAQPEVFDRAVEPCTVEVESDGLRGAMRCPRVTNSSGRSFGLIMRWGPK